jgi:formate C-acetyltransferase
MNTHIQNLLQFFIVDKKHTAYRQKPIDAYVLAQEFETQGKADVERAEQRLLWMLFHEQPVVFKDEKIAILRTMPVIAEIHTEQEMAILKQKHHIHELGKVCNVNPGYSKLLDVGFEQKKDEISKAILLHQTKGNEEGVLYLQSLQRVLDAIQQFADRYRVEAERVGNTVVAESFAQIPRRKPKTFLQALQFFRLLHFCLWESYNYHNTIGRFDQYMISYYQHDREMGLLIKSEALHLLEEFFISFNKDSDLYPGMQQGDNGQSMVLGGLNEDGTDAFNDLSRLCMEASLELHLIDPKINLRVHSKTSDEVYALGTQMTKQGLGFPQYTNDEIAIPALIRWGYAEQDAYQYVVAACWELIIPRVAMDVVNIDGLSFLGCVVDALPLLPDCLNYDAFSDIVRSILEHRVTEICANTANVAMEHAPLLSLMMDGCVSSARDISLGSAYNNYGIHGTGLSSAADSLAAIKTLVFEQKRIDAKTLVCALEANWEGYEDLRAQTRFDMPKMGNDDDRVDTIATQLLDWFADSLEGKKNDRGGIFRAGTGSAMYYLWHANGLGATPDGRDCGEAFSCNFSPSLFAKVRGPLSLISSFSKANLIRVANGGPLTIELHDTMFRNDESIKKVAAMVKTYMQMGGMQLQLNAVNREKMLDAQKHPEKYRNLIVRVWGWSGYFVELDKVYQDHIISRMEFSL